MTEQSGDALRDWLRERGANARRLAALKTGQDRAGWLEDAAYFDAAALAVSRATPPTPEQAGPSLGISADELFAMTRDNSFHELDAPEQAGPSGEALLTAAEAVSKGATTLPGVSGGIDRVTAGVPWALIRELRTALASPGAMEGATERAAKVCDFLAELMENGGGEDEPGTRLRQAARSIREQAGAMEGAQAAQPTAWLMTWADGDEELRWEPIDRVYSGESPTKVVPLYAHPPTGEPA